MTWDTDRLLGAYARLVRQASKPGPVLCLLDGDDVPVPPQTDASTRSFQPASAPFSGVATPCSWVIARRPESGPGSGLSAARTASASQWPRGDAEGRYAQPPSDPSGSHAGDPPRPTPAGGEQERGPRAMHSVPPHFSWATLLMDNGGEPFSGVLVGPPKSDALVFDEGRWLSGALKVLTEHGQLALALPSPDVPGAAAWEEALNAWLDKEGFGAVIEVEVAGARLWLAARWLSGRFRVALPDESGAADPFAEDIKALEAQLDASKRRQLATKLRADRADALASRALRGWQEAEAHSAYVAEECDRMRERLLDLDSELQTALFAVDEAKNAAFGAPRVDTAQRRLEGRLAGQAWRAYAAENAVRLQRDVRKQLRERLDRAEASEAALRHEAAQQGAEKQAYATLVKKLQHDVAALARLPVELEAAEARREDAETLVREAAVRLSSVEARLDESRRARAAAAEAQRLAEMRLEEFRVRHHAVEAQRGTLSHALSGVLSEVRAAQESLVSRAWMSGALGDANGASGLPQDGRAGSPREEGPLPDAR